MLTKFVYSYCQIAEPDNSRPLSNNMIPWESYHFLLIRNVSNLDISRCARKNITLGASTILLTAARADFEASSPLLSFSSGLLGIELIMAACIASLDNCRPRPLLLGIAARFLSFQKKHRDGEARYKTPI